MTPSPDASASVDDFIKDTIYSGTRSRGRLIHEPGSANEPNVKPIQGRKRATRRETTLALALAPEATPKANEQV